MTKKRNRQVVRPFGVLVMSATLIGGESIAVAASAESVAAARSNAAAPYDIIQRVQYSGSGKIPLRKGKFDGTRGFGWDKIYFKHNITTFAAVEYVANSPNRAHDTGTTYVHRSFANEVTCSQKACQLTDQVPVRQVIDERRLSDGKRFGVVTQYCEGIEGKCPDWVTEVLTEGAYTPPARPGVVDDDRTVHYSRTYYADDERLPPRAR